MDLLILKVGDNPSPETTLPEITPRAKTFGEYILLIAIRLDFRSYFTSFV